MALSRFCIISRHLQSHKSVTVFLSNASRQGWFMSCRATENRTEGGENSSLPLTFSRLNLADDTKTHAEQYDTSPSHQVFEPNTHSTLGSPFGRHQHLESQHLSGSSKVEMEYKCPSRLLGNFPQLVILDNNTAVKSVYDCPQISSLVDTMKAPNIHKSEIKESPGSVSPAKEAKIIMRIRHKKMKKHKLKKLRKRMYFVWRKQKLARRAKRAAIYKKELTEIKKSGDDFSAEEFVREQLAKARKGGYHVNILK